MKKLLLTLSCLSLAVPAFAGRPAPNLATILSTVNLVTLGADDQVLATWIRKQAPDISFHMYLSKDGMLTCEAKDTQPICEIYLFSKTRLGNRILR
jgi:hypothetical protein